jgi:hypothetical protein
MIIAKLRGGLSNQMFQYAAARRLAHIHKTDLKLDINWYLKPQPGITPRNFELDNFNISSTLANEYELIGLDGIAKTHLKHLAIAIFRKILPKILFVNEKQYHFDESILKLQNDVCLFGYYVSEKYFIDIASIIRKEFTVKTAIEGKNKELADLILNSNSVSIHVRRGDYVSNPEYKKMYGLCSPKYYSDCIHHISQLISNPVFFVFSDDLNWAKENLEIPFEKYFVDNNQNEKSFEDIRLMSLCKHNIIANSGFSWWGAWLNTNEQKNVYAPKNWFNDAPYNTKDVIPEKWILL